MNIQDLLKQAVENEELKIADVILAGLVSVAKEEKDEVFILADILEAVRNGSSDIKKIFSDRGEIVGYNHFSRFLFHLEDKRKSQVPV